jgi:hypothetical protein
MYKFIYDKFIYGKKKQQFKAIGFNDFKSIFNRE